MTLTSEECGAALDRNELDDRYAKQRHFDLVTARNAALEEAVALCIRLQPELENKDYLTEAWGRAVAHLARQLRALKTDTGN